MTAMMESILSIEEAIELCPNEWIFMEVAAEDEYAAPSHGRILAHHPNRDIIQESIMKVISQREGHEIYYLFEGYPRGLSFSDCLQNLDESTITKLDEIELLILGEDTD